MKKHVYYFNIIKNILAARFLGMQRPLQVSFSITDRCNLKCLYCYGNFGSNWQNDLTFEEIKACVDYLKRKGMVDITLTGGEPLLRKDFGEIVDYLNKAGIRISMVSNGALVPRKIDLLKGFRHVIISIDGDEKSNDRNRGKGSHRKAIDALEALKGAGVDFSIKAVFNRNTVDQLDYLLALAERYSCKLETVIPYENFGDPELYLSREEKVRLLERILLLARQGKPILFSPVTHEMSLQVFKKYGTTVVHDSHNEKYPECIGGKLYLFFAPNGDVYPCNTLMGNWDPLNFRKVGLPKAVQHALKHDCTLCGVPFLNEKRFLFSLHPHTLINMFRKGRKS